MSFLSTEQLESFVSDGYIVLKDIVPRQVVNSARKLFFQNVSNVLQKSQRAASSLSKDSDNSQVSRVREELQKATHLMRSMGRHSNFQDLVASDSTIRLLIDNLIGKSVRGFQYAQVATQFPRETSNLITESGYPECDIPFYGWHGHLDGLWNGAMPPHQAIERPMSKEEWEAWNKDPGTNSVLRTYPGTGANLTNFTALLGIPLSDQSNEGAGNLGLLKGAHHPIERFFQLQRDSGGPLGPDGPEWERIDRQAPNGCGLRHYPEQVREEFPGNALYTEDRRMWPKPDLVRMDLGDAVLVHYGVPHGATRCEASEPRIMVYFRLTSSDRPENSNHNFIDALCDCWLEWKGIRSKVEEIRRASA